MKPLAITFKAIWQSMTHKPGKTRPMPTPTVFHWPTIEYSISHSKLKHISADTDTDTSPQLIKGAWDAKKAWDAKEIFHHGLSWYLPSASKTYTLSCKPRNRSSQASPAAGTHPKGVCCPNLLPKGCWSPPSKQTILMPLPNAPHQSINHNARPAMPMAKPTQAINTRLLITITKPHNQW